MLEEIDIVKLGFYHGSMGMLSYAYYENKDYTDGILAGKAYRAKIEEMAKAENIESEDLIIKAVEFYYEENYNGY